MADVLLVRAIEFVSPIQNVFLDCNFPASNHQLGYQFVYISALKTAVTCSCVAKSKCVSVQNTATRSPPTMRIQNKPAELRREGDGVFNCRIRFIKLVCGDTKEMRWMLIVSLIEMQLIEVLSDALQSNVLFKQMIRWSSLCEIAMNGAQTGPETAKNKFVSWWVNRRKCN